MKRIVVALLLAASPAYALPPQVNSAGVASFDGRSGAVSLLAADVAAALGYTAASPASVVAALGGALPATAGLYGGTGTAGAATSIAVGSGLSLSGGTLTASGTAGVGSFNGRSGAVSLLSADVAAALGFAPYSAANPAGYQTSGQVSSAIAAAAPGVASTATAGLVKVDGTSIVISGGVISASGGLAIVPVTTVAASGASYTLATAASGSSAYDITLTANCVLSLSGGTAGQQQTITVYLRQNSTAGWTPTLPTNVKWSGGVAPVPNSTAGVIDVYSFRTPDAGATWFGSF